MTTSKKQTVKPPIVSIDGLSKNDAITALVRDGMDFKAAEKHYKEFGSGRRASKTGALMDCLAFLEEAPRTQKELYDWIFEEGTKNEATWATQRDSIRKVTIAIYKKAGYDFTEELANDNLKELVKNKAAGK